MGLEEMNANVDPSLQMLVCSYISEQLDKLMAHVEGVRRGEDIEDVHQVRVVCRRLRAAMQLFSDGFEEKMMGGWRKQIKKLLKSFGAARDLDVQVAYLEQKLQDLTAEQKVLRPGVRRMLLRWRQKRQVLQPQILKAIRSLEKKKVLTNIHVEMQKILFVLKPQKPARQSPVVYQRVYDRIGPHVQEVRQRRAVLDDPSDVQGHHALRIAAKKLRYVMEIGAEALGDELTSALKTVKTLQTLLGEMHDGDVWGADMDRFIEEERGRTKEFYGDTRPLGRLLPGLEYLRSERQDSRERFFGQARELMEGLEQQEFWPKLLETLETLVKQHKGATGEEPSEGSWESSNDGRV